jgi:ribosomal protein S18 acetylase RimI-like enzyme
VVLATREELPAILAVQREAFGRVAEMFSIDSAQLPPLTETEEDLGALFDAGIVFFAAHATDGSVVGSVRAEVRGGTVEVGRLVVTHTVRRRGVASALMRALEDSFPEAERFELFTGAEADVPLALYTKLGYQVYEERTVGTLLLVWMEKRV